MFHIAEEFLDRYGVGGGVGGVFVYGGGGGSHYGGRAGGSRTTEQLMYAIKNDR